MYNVTYVFMNSDVSINLRINKKLSYMVDLAARINNTTKTNVIKAAIVKAFESDGRLVFALEQTWDFDEKERLKKLQAFDRSLLKYNEEEELHEAHTTEDK